MLKLVQYAPGQFDLAFDNPAERDNRAKAATIVYAAIFTDAEAPPARVENPHDRRGYWAEPQAGSGCWHIRRQPFSRNARLEAISEVKRVLARHAPALTDFTVSENTKDFRPSAITLDISAKYGNENIILQVSL